MMIAEEIPKYLKGIKYKKDNICTELGLYWSEDDGENQMMKDIIAWLKTVIFRPVQPKFCTNIIFFILDSL